MRQRNRWGLRNSIKIILGHIDMQSNTIYITKLGSEIIGINKSRLSCHRFLKTSIPVQYQSWLKSYQQFFRDINKHGQVIISLPDYPTFIIKPYTLNP